jgi:hypothetical protein
MSVRTEQLTFHRKYFHEILYLLIFRKSVEEIQVRLKSDQNNGQYVKSYLNLWQYFLDFFLD